MVNDKLREQLVRDEGMRRFPYVDTVGKITCGVGRNLTDVGISYATAEQMLEEDIDTAVGALTRGYSWYGTLDPVRKAVVINVMFNVGASSYAKFRHMNAALSLGDYRRAAVELRDSHLAPARRERLARQLETGLWDGKPAPGIVFDVAGPIVSGGLDS